MECSLLIPIAVFEAIGYFILWPILKKRPKLAVPRQFAIADIAVLFCYVQVAMALVFYERSLLENSLGVGVAMALLGIGAVVIWGTAVSLLNQLEIRAILRRLVFLLVLLPGVVVAMVGLPLAFFLGGALDVFREDSNLVYWLLFGLLVVAFSAVLLRQLAVWLAQDAKDLSAPAPMVIVADYDPAWPIVFARLRDRLEKPLGDIATSIEHVGSTSVPGLAAKSTIDIGVIVPSQIDVALAIVRLAALGYVHRGNLGIAGREAFRSPADLPPHNLYVYPQGNDALANHLAIRDHLRRHPASAAAYGQLKKELARKFPQDMNFYGDGKTDFLLAILRGEGFTANQLTEIEKANRKT